MLPQRSQAQNPIIQLLTLTFSCYRRPACDLVRQRSRANPLLPAATGGARTKGDHQRFTRSKGESARERTGQQSHPLAQEKDRSRYRVGAGRERRCRPGARSIADECRWGGIQPHVVRRPRFSGVDRRFPGQKIHGGAGGIRTLDTPLERITV
jgi:hypothetical protein